MVKHGKTILLDKINAKFSVFFFFLNDPAPPDISPLPQHAALPISFSPTSTDSPSPRRSRPACLPEKMGSGGWMRLDFMRTKREHIFLPPASGVPPCPSHRPCPTTDRKITRLNSSHLVISYAVFCLK